MTGRALATESSAASSPVASLLRSRPAALALVVFGALQIALGSRGLPGWPCPVRHALGIPCPGCGLTRAAIALLSGDWRAGLELHAFAPVALLALALVAVASLLPEQPRLALATAVERVERRTRLSAVLLLGLLSYWIVRLALFPATSTLLAG